MNMIIIIYCNVNVWRLWPSSSISSTSTARPSSSKRSSK